MFYHVKSLQFDARISKPDPRFARILLEQFGGPNGELKAAMQYFTQAFTCRVPYPDKYDLLMDIATEEFSHLEIVGATIQMLLGNTSGELKDLADSEDITTLMDGQEKKEHYMHQAMFNPQFCNESGGGPTVTDSNGNPWTGAYVNANGDLTVDLRSNMAAEGRAKIVYEYLMKFTDDPSVKETLTFLMTREIAHFQMFEAALDSIQPNFPTGVRQGDARFSNKYFPLSMGEKAEGPWNTGKSTKLGEQWEIIEDPEAYIMETKGLKEMDDPKAEKKQPKNDQLSKKLSKERKNEIETAIKEGGNVWSDYDSNSTEEV